MSVRYAKPGGKGRGIGLHAKIPSDAGARPVRRILWGDWLNIQEEQGDWGRIAWGDKTYWVRLEDTQDERLLEIIFVDVGQGDGCFIVAPHPTGEKRIVVDAGEDSNMSRFLGWRFRLSRGWDVSMHAAVITHSDKDHYLGFQPLFDTPNLTFERVYHNGIAERAGQDIFGPRSGGYLTDIADTHERIEAIYADPANLLTPAGNPKMYPSLILSALKKGKAASEVSMLSTATAEMADGRAWMPGFAPQDSSPLSIEVLGPVVEPGASGELRLRTFDETPKGKGFSDAHTKNGHSILLKLRYGEFSLLLGGDLNKASEDFLLRHYGEVGPDAPLSAAVAKARLRLGADMLKSCHHGSSDVTDEFLQAVNPCGFVISSGDSEGHAHPRPDLLGRLGRHGRGDAPLILCTELLRSTREREKADDLQRLGRLNQLIEEPTTKPDRRKKAREDRDELQERLTKRNVEVYGAITMRTDGRRLVIAFRHEDSENNPSWQTFWYEHDATDGFKPVQLS